jgi:putative ABC transport system permease protein
METFLKDLRYAFRMMLKNPGFTAVAIIALALGIGANTAIFSVVNALLINPLPYKDASRLVWIWGSNPGRDIEQETASAPDYIDWKTQNQSFEEMGAFSRTRVTLTGEGEPEIFLGAVVTDGFFATLGAQPRIGRLFLPEEDKPGAERRVILSEGLWQRRFGGDPQILERKITLNGNPFIVVGVMPADFLNPRPGDTQPTEVWIPLRQDYNKAGRRSDFLGVIARLKADVSLEQARAEMKTIAAALEQQYPNSNAGWTTKTISLHERFFGDIRPALLVLMGAVCFLLLIACANIANLLLARSASRRKEVAIRAALGASRRRVVQQLLTESIILALAGGVFGLLLAVWGIEALVALAPSNIPRLSSIGLDPQVLTFTLSVSLITGIIFGLLPALQASNPHLIDNLKEGGRDSSDTVRGNRLRGILAAAEIGLALVLLIGAGLMARSFNTLQNVDPGFDPARVLTTQMLLPGARYGEDPKVIDFTNRFVEQVSAMPGVEAVGIIDTVPLSGGGNVLSFTIEGAPPVGEDEASDAEAFSASGSYFKAMGIPLKRGRLFNEQDTVEAPGVMLISETMARRYFQNEDPIGKRVTFGGPWSTVVGIVGDVHHGGLNEEPYPQIYVAATQQPSNLFTLVARTSVPGSVIPAIRSQVRQMDADLPLFNINSMEQLLSNSISRPRFNALLIGLFAVVALILASVGIYGVISYSVTQRQHEIGIRMALGAKSQDIMKMVLNQGLKLAGAGVICGLGAAFGLTRLMSSLLYGVSATDPLTFLGIAALLTLVALVACYIPARRATKVDPMEALRYE